MNTYSVTIGDTSFYVKADNLKQAKSYAQFNKRHGGYKGVTYVRRIKTLQPIH